MSSLDANSLGLRITGRAKAPLSAVVERPLSEEDLSSLDELRESKPAPIKRLRERHHALAKQLAQGVSEGEAAIACGYSSSRISILKDDPSFKELLAFYADGLRERYYDMHEMLSALGKDAAEELSTRLEEEPEEFTNGMLMDLLKTSADRSGHGPSSNTQVNIKVGLADKLEAARKRTLELRAKDVTPQETE